MNFRGEARAALELYGSVVGGRVSVVTYDDAHAVQDPADAGRVLWGEVVGDGGFHVMAYDVPARTPFERGVNSTFVSVRSTSPEEVSACWAGLAEGGRVVQDLAPSGWSPLYGMLEDRFGIVWVLDVVPTADPTAGSGAGAVAAP
nr:VOC family protein [Kineococcus vitellinus]